MDTLTSARSREAATENARSDRHGRYAAALALPSAAATSSSAPLQPAARCGAPSRHATTLTFAAADRVRLDGAIIGRGKQRVVLVPEAGARALCGWWPYAATLARHGFHVLLFDRRCYGLSACPTQGADRVADDAGAAVALLRRRGRRTVELVDASLGGSAALVAAAHDRRITAVADLSADENATPMTTNPPRTALAAAREIRQPSLIAVARGDPYVTVQAETAIASALATPRKQLFIEPAGAGHGWDMLTISGTGWSTLAAALTRFLTAHSG